MSLIKRKSFTLDKVLLTIFVVLVVLASISSEGKVLKPEYGPLLNEETSEGDVLLVLTKDGKKFYLGAVYFHENELTG